jgi:predicted metal-dependent enzyme (double-stranded beta helix superfamily)
LVELESPRVVALAYTDLMNRESSESHLEEVKKVLKDFVERYEILGERERDELKDRAKKELGHIEGVIAYVHSTDKE